MSKQNEQLEALLADYVDGTLDDRERAEVDRYLAANPTRRAIVESMRRQRGVLQSLPREAAPGEFREEVQSQLERTLLLGSQSLAPSASDLRINRWPQIRAAAAILLLVGGVAAAVYWSLPDPRHRPPELAGDFPELPEVPADDPSMTRRDDGALAREGQTGLPEAERPGPARDSGATAATPLESAPTAAPAARRPDATGFEAGVDRTENRPAAEATAVPGGEPRIALRTPVTPSMATTPELPLREAASPPAVAASAEPGVAAGGGAGEPAAPVAAGQADELAWQPVALGGMTATSERSEVAATALREPVPQVAAFADADLILLVRTDDAAFANGQVNRYFLDNRIAVTPTPPPTNDAAPSQASPAEGVGGELGFGPTAPAEAMRPASPQAAVLMRQRAAGQLEVDSPSAGPRSVAGVQVGLPLPGVSEPGVLAAAAEEALRSLSAEPMPSQQWLVAKELTEEQAVELSESLQVPASRQQVQAFGRRSALSLQQNAPVQANRLQQGPRDSNARLESKAIEEPAAEATPIAIDDVLLIAMPIGEQDVREVRAKVAGDGTIDVPLLGRIELAGLTPTQAVERINAGLRQSNLGRPLARSAIVRRADLPAIGRGGWGGGGAAADRATGDQAGPITPAEPTTSPLQTPRRLNVVVVIESIVPTAGNLASPDAADAGTPSVPASPATPGGPTADAAPATQPARPSTRPATPAAN